MIGSTCSFLDEIMGKAATDLFKVHGSCTKRYVNLWQKYLFLGKSRSRRCLRRKGNCISHTRQCARRSCRLVPELRRTKGPGTEPILRQSRVGRGMQRSHPNAPAIRRRVGAALWSRRNEGRAAGRFMQFHSFATFDAGPANPHLCFEVLALAPPDRTRLPTPKHHPCDGCGLARLAWARAR